MNETFKSRKRRAFFAFSLFFLFSAIPLSALDFPGVYGNSMVLLRDTRLPFFGKSEPGASVHLTLDGKEYHVKAGPGGDWKIMLEPHRAGGPFDILVSDEKSKKVFHDVMFGEVWIVSGQSNMAFPLYSKQSRFDRADGGKEAMESAGKYSDLRLCRALFRTGSFGASDRKDLRWVRSNPRDAAGFSAIGFLFGRALQQKLNVPVGIVSCAFPATRAEAWLPEDTIRKMNLAEDIALLDARDRAGVKKEALRWETERRKRQAVYLWMKKGKKGPEPPAFDKKTYIRYGQNFPSTQFNGMIYPFLKFPIRGMLWYQGESNARNPALYAKLLPAMLKEYRANWCTPDFAFIAAQLSAWYKHARMKPLADDFWEKIPPEKSAWAEIREAQERILDLFPRTGLVVTLDHGDHSNIHPTNKGIVADRMLGEALRICYGEKNILPCPRFDRAVREGKTMRVYIRNSGGGLLPLNANVGNFTLAGKDGVFHKAEASTDGESVVVRCPKVPVPTAVRYAWANYPGDLKLYAKSGLPLGSFRSDSPFINKNKQQ